MPGLDLKAVLGSTSVEGLSLEGSGEAASAPGLDLKGARQTAPCALQRWSRSKWEQFVLTRPTELFYRNRCCRHRRQGDLQDYRTPCSAHGNWGSACDGHARDASQKR